MRKPAKEILLTKKVAHRVSFIIPALNEERVVEGVVRETWTIVNRAIEIYEIILIDDGSTDSTEQIMDALARELPNTKVIHNGTNIGLGASYLRGVGAATLDYVMLFCGDGGLPASSLPPIIALIGTADMVVLYMVNLRQIRTPIRYVISRTYTNLLNLSFGLKLQYYNGLAVHRRALLNQIEIGSIGYGFQAEVILKLAALGCSMVEVGVHAAELSERTRAFRLRNILDLAGTILGLFAELRRFDKTKTLSRSLHESEALIDRKIRLPHPTGRNDV